MAETASYDVVVVGAGPNGLAAAITCAQAGRSTLLIEAHETLGGGTRTAELTLPGYLHDICSAAHPLGLASPFFRRLPLSKYGLEFVIPPAAAAHPLDGRENTVAMLETSLEATADTLRSDGKAYRRLMTPLVRNWEKILADSLGPFPLPPAHPFVMAGFGLQARHSIAGLARSHFREGPARALFAGIASHVMLPLDAPFGAAFGLVLGTLGHAAGWPLVKGGSGCISAAMAGLFRDLGGKVITGWKVSALSELPKARVYLLDITPRQLLAMAGAQLPPGYRRQLERFRYGPGVYKVDWALSEPIPWKSPQVARTATVHLGGSLEEIEASENGIWRGEHAEQPYTLLVQPTLFDPSRAPEGKHTAWGYCHVPHGSTVDMLERIEAQVERFAPGFRDTILARHTFNSEQMEAYNPNYVGGDINGGVQDMWQLFTRPVARWVPYSTPLKGVYLCSSSTPPGGGVHGMCGYQAARAALRANYRQSG